MKEGYEEEAEASDGIPKLEPGNKKSLKKPAFLLRER
jgi:hypothetical protein